MDIKKAIEFGEDRADLFGGKMEEFIKMSVEALKNQRPKGHWLEYWDEEARTNNYKCSECGYKQPFDTNYCWECGADMREEIEKC